jgi:hypothetical protein
MQLIKRRNPRCEAVEQHRTQYLFLAAQLFASPSTYWHALQPLHLTIAASRSWAPCACLIANLTIDDLVRLFAEQGISEEQADDVFEYAYQWLAKAIADRPSQSAKIQSVLDEVNCGNCSLDSQPSCMRDHYQRIPCRPHHPVRAFQ